MSSVCRHTRLTMECHIEELLSSCASSIHALRMLRSHGLGPTQVHEVARMTTLAYMLYASPAWWGFTTAQTETGWKDLSGGSAEEGSSWVMLSPLLTWP